MNSREEIYNASPKIPPAWETTGGRAEPSCRRGERDMCRGGARAGRTKQLPRPTLTCRSPSGGQDTKRRETAGV